MKGSVCRFLTALGITASVIRGKNCSTCLTMDKQVCGGSDSETTKQPESTGDKTTKDTKQGVPPFRRQHPRERTATRCPRTQSFHVSETITGDLVCTKEMWNVRQAPLPGHLHSPKKYKTTTSLTYGAQVSGTRSFSRSP